MVTHMGGEPMTVDLGDWLELDMNKWEISLATPGLNQGDQLKHLHSFEMKDSQGLLLKKSAVS